MSIKIVPRKASLTSLPMTDRLAVSKKEAAAMLGVSERSLNNWVRQGKLTARKAGTRLLFPVKSLQNFLDGVEPE